MDEGGCYTCGIQSLSIHSRFILVACKHTTKHLRWAKELLVNAGLARAGVLKMNFGNFEHAVEANLGPCGWGCPHRRPTSVTGPLVI